MPDLTQELFERLRQTQGDPQAQAVVTADFALRAVPEPQGGAIRAALDAAAVLHWFDASRLAALLEVPSAEAAGQVETLKGLAFVEKFPRPGTDALNVHEATRLGWRRRLAREASARFRDLSAKAAGLFADDRSTEGRIERVYHLLCTEGEPGQAALLELAKAWAGDDSRQERQSLALALQEFSPAEPAGDAASVEAAEFLLNTAFQRGGRGEYSQLELPARTARALLENRGRPQRLAHACCLLADVMVAQGRLKRAQAAFEEYQAISQKLAAQDPANAAWQRELAVSHSRVGDVRLAQGDLAGAHTAFEARMAVFEKLAKLDAANAGWQRGLAVSHSRVGDVRLAQGDLAGARAAFEADLGICQKLAAQDPANAAWQRELALAHYRVGQVAQRDGDISATRREWKIGLAIFERLTTLDPTNADWRENTAALRERLADLPPAP